MLNNDYQLVIIGYGGMGSQHARLLKSVDRLTVRGTFDIDEQKQLQAKSDGYNVYNSLEDVLTDDRVDVILITTPNDAHKDIAIKALSAGKNVICDKPVTLNSKQFEEILECEKKSGKRFFVHQNRRWDEDFLTIKKIVDEKIIGDTFHIETRVHGSRGIPGDWRKIKAHGGGMMLDWGVHLLDRLLILVKEKVKTIYCSFSYAMKQEVEDGFMLYLTFENGVTATVEVGTCNYISLPKWYVCGTTGTAVIEDWEMNGKILKLRTYEGNDAQPIEAGAGFTKTMAPRDELTVVEEPLPIVRGDVRDFYRNIIDVLDGKAQPVVKNSEVLRLMKLVDFAFESAETNRAINL